jgi:hypothetical protein
MIEAALMLLTLCVGMLIGVGLTVWIYAKPSEKEPYDPWRD